MSPLKPTFTPRQCLFLLLYCPNEFPHKHRSKETFDFTNFLYENQEIQNNYVVNTYSNDALMPTETKTLKSFCESFMINENALDWINVKHREKLLYINDLIRNYRPEKGSNIKYSYHSIDSQYYEFSSKNLKNRIFIYFDIKVIGNIELKLNFLDYFKNSLIHALSLTESYLKWIAIKDKNEDFILWLLNYQNTFFENEMFMEETIKTSIEFQLDAIKVHAMKCAQMDQSLFDLYFMKAKSAWSQKKHRDKKSDKISRTYALNKNCIKQLDELSTTLKKGKTELIEELISNAYMNRVSPH